MTSLFAPVGPVTSPLVQLVLPSGFSVVKATEPLPVHVSTKGRLGSGLTVTALANTSVSAPNALLAISVMV